MDKKGKMEDDDTSIDKYHLTTNSNKELIFDEQTGRFFETSIRPGSFHQLWQEFLQKEEKDTAIGESERGQSTATSKFSNEMVPTRSLFRRSSTNYQVDIETEPEECLVHTPYQDTCDPLPLDASDEDIISERSPTTIVEQCYAAWNQRDMEDVAECFADVFEYQDSQYIGKMTNKGALIQHFDRQAHLLPTNSRIVVDYVAKDSENGNIATQWHIERQSGSMVPFTKGISFYTTRNGLIVKGFRVSEMLVKPSKNSVSRMIAIMPKSPQSSTTTSNAQETNIGNANASIIEQYFEAWNKRHIEAALDCFVEDCVYQTEDPVFADTFEGKTALREHLNKNADVLPSSCKIVLDKIAADAENGNIGTRWHLEVNGIAIPNLQGCSMYTTDTETGLLKTGFDVTEAPVKLPREVMPFLWAPAVAIFDLSS
jgi:ketosteroid isomerase-like protein